MAMQSGFIKRIRDIMRMDAGINGDAQRIEQMVWMLFLKVYDAKEDDWELNEDNYKSIIPEDLRWRNWAKADSNGHAMTGDKLLNFVNNTLFPVLKGNDVKEGDTIIYEGIKVTPDTPIKKAIVKSTFEDANNYMKDGVYLRQVIDVIDEIEFDDVKESHAFGFVYEEILRELQSAGSSGEFYTPRAVTEFMALMIKPKLGEKMAEKTLSTLIQTNDTYESTQIDAFFESKPKIDAFLKIDANAQKVGIQNGILTPDVLETGCRFYVCGIFLVCFLYCVLRTSEKRAVSSFPLSCMPRLIHSSIHP